MPYRFHMVMLNHNHTRDALPKDTEERFFTSLHHYFNTILALNINAQVHGITYLPCNNAMIQLNNMEERDEPNRDT